MDIISPITTPSHIMLDKKSLFQSDMNGDIPTIGFNEEQGHIEVPGLLDDSEAINSEPLFP